jgi:hypothetical protein
MVEAVVFKTPGIIPIRAFTAFGVNAKPESSHPIGVFGTGLKYAIAILIRHKLKVVMYRGTTKYEFLSRKVDFRGQEKEFIDLKRSRGLFNKTTELPFTTDLGKHWELWQAFRELYSNTLDENGEAWVVEDIPGYPINSPDDKRSPNPTKTVIEVWGEEFVREFYKREKTFLPDALMHQDSTKPIQIFDRPSNHIYYRGLRVMDLKEPSELTYNILETIELTEDRTVKSEFNIRMMIANAIRLSESPEEIKRFVNAPKERFEQEIGLRSHGYSDVSKIFLDTIAELPSAGSQAKEVLKSFRPDPKVKISKENLIAALISAIASGDRDKTWEIINENRTYVIARLRESVKIKSEMDDEIPL